MKCNISRRDFMKGAAVVAASGLLAGCDGETPAPSSSGSSSNSGSSSGSSSSGSSSGSSSSSSTSSSSDSSSSSSSSSGAEEEPHIMWTYKKKTDGSICLTGYDKTAEIIPEGRVEIPAQYDGFTVSELSYPFFIRITTSSRSSFRRRSRSLAHRHLSCARTCTALRCPRV